MELRVLEYFLAVAREQSFSAAADFLHLTQPTLSRQIRDLEEEFSKPLFIRGKRKVTLTEDGLFFRKKAEEIVTLAQRTEAEMKNSDSSISGDIYIGAGETEALCNIARVAHQLQEEFSDIHFHIISGDSTDLIDRLDKGLFDFCLLLSPPDRTKYEVLSLPYEDTWGVLMRRDAPLAKKEEVEAEDLLGLPLILSRQMEKASFFRDWLKIDMERLNIAATYNLAFNASLMAREHMGYVLTLDKLINTEGKELCFRPLAPRLRLGMSLVWKKYHPKSKAAEKFIEALEKYLENSREDIL